MVAATEEDPREESIKVCLRIRPLNPSEKVSGNRVCVELPDNGVAVRVPSNDALFTFDKVFRWNASQKEVYDYAAKPIIESVLRGFNGTVFAYGQTASGKTYTMEGPDIEDKHWQGIIPRMVWSIFEGIYNAEEHIEFMVKVSIVEIYNERIRDLLDPKKDNLKIHEDKARGIFIGEVTESYAGCEQEIFVAMRVGHTNRAVAETNMNEHSSRSHLIFTLTIEQKNLHDRSVKSGKLHLVDLAGSEKVNKTGSTAERLDEAKNINKSLSALGNVINALTDSRYTHVPYRDSKLTRILQESLGGNSKTCLIITCSPAVTNEQETLSTLRFGQRAKMIKNVVKVNLERSTEELKLMLEKKDRVALDLKARLTSLEQLLKAHGVPLPNHSLATTATTSPAARDSPTSAGSGALAELVDEVQDKQAEVREAAERIGELEREREEMQRQLGSSQEDKQRVMSRLSELAGDREGLERDLSERKAEVRAMADDKGRLLQELEELHRRNLGGPMASLLSSWDAQSANAATMSSQPSTEEFSPPSRRDIRVASDASTVCSDEKPQRSDATLLHKVSQLDKNIQQLTVHYHRLVAQNTGLKVEAREFDKKLVRKDQRIVQLERNLREAKQKYEKLLTQCANLTAAMDVMGRSRAPAPTPVSNGTASGTPAVAPASEAVSALARAAHIARRAVWSVF
eukprot:TRINITY_DN912_c0_g4_i1.p1 TRINITY_DN912_c0_g4~~TRINITY_DN912_c0_g4_i1.p1  ORF type:complete len:686 (+),score=178.33 TRINITY_DN912_c0_g4_i1:234-2291(+)